MELRKIVGVKVSDTDYEHEILTADGGKLGEAMIAFRSVSHAGDVYEGHKDGTFTKNGELVTELDVRDSYATMALDAVVGEVFEDDDCYAHNYSYVDNQAFRL
jgi:hypothetical protein